MIAFFVAPGHAGSMALLCCWILRADVNILKSVDCCIKWLLMVSNNKSTNDSASIITTRCRYCGTKVSLVMLVLFKVLQQGWKQDNGMGKRNFSVVLSRGSYKIGN
jgi:hypothetical protein